MRAPAEARLRCDRMGIETGVSVFGIQDVAEDLVVPIMDFPIRSDRDALTMGPSANER